MSALHATTGLALIALGACSSTPITNGRYIGAVTPTTPGPLCPATRGVAKVKDSIITFTPDEGTWVLQGSLEPDGTLSADRSQIGVNKQPWETTLEARWTLTSITGTYKTPRCNYTVTLTRPSPG